MMQGDVVTNANLKEAIDMHFASKKKGAGNSEGASNILTKIFA